MSFASKFNNASSTKSAVNFKASTSRTTNLKSGLINRTVSLICFAVAVFSVMFASGFLTVRAEQSCAECMAAVETTTGRVLYSINADKKRPMASTTKIVTAITVLENCSDLCKLVKVPAAAVGVEGSSIYLQKDEPLSIKDLLHGLMLQSGNDCAVALAVTVGGSVEKFAQLMNETAIKAGAKNSNFVNPHGLHNDNHYTTARDLGLITAYAMRNPTFKQIVSTKRYEAPWEGRDYNRVIINKNKLLNSYQGADGVKTGFTKKAGRCLVSSATRGNMQVICVVLNCGPMFEECGRIMDRAFEQYSMQRVCAKDLNLYECKVTEGKTKTVTAAPSGEFYYPLKKEGEYVEVKADTVDFLAAPVKMGQEAGKINFYLNKQLIYSAKLVTINEAQSLSVGDRLKDIVDNWTR